MRRKDRLVEDRAELQAIFDEAEVCRLGFAQGGTPYIVTMNFGYSWEAEFPLLYFHCAREGRKLDMMRANPRVCFQLDAAHELVTGPAPCDWGMKYASIVGYGVLGEAAGEEERREGLDRIMGHYGWAGEGSYAASVLGATTLLTLRVDELSGKRKG
jgi:uncharacterized protein